MFENIEHRTCSTFHGHSKNVIVNRPPVKTKENEMKRALDGFDQTIPVP